MPPRGNRGYLSDRKQLGKHTKKTMSRQDNDKNRSLYEDSYDHEEYDGYSQEDLDRMYEEAFEGDSEAQWNIY